MCGHSRKSSHDSVSQPLQAVTDVVNALACQLSQSGYRSLASVIADFMSHSRFCSPSIAAAGSKARESLASFVPTDRSLDTSCVSAHQLPGLSTRGMVCSSSGVTMQRKGEKGCRRGRHCRMEASPLPPVDTHLSLTIFSNANSPHVPSHNKTT